jgi:glycosyltransferase involved in cell wall biosynthesis
MRVLHVLSQRPSLTGSGVTLDAIVRHAAEAGWDQRVVVGVPADDPRPNVGDLAIDEIHPLVFEHGALDFPVPGMSDVMPYPSTRFGSMTTAQLASYRSGWRRHLRPLIDTFQPQIIHSHHVWLMSALLKDLAPATPVVTHCHATGLRQMQLVPHLSDEVRKGCSRNDAFLVLHRGHAADLAHELTIRPERVRVVGAGYREDLFHRSDDGADPTTSLLFIGKYSAAKGLPWLLDAFEHLAARRRGLELHIAGDGSGDEADSLRRRMTALGPDVVLHGQLSQPELAQLMRRSRVCVLPSFYEGLPLVLVEALACGCRLVATELPGVVNELAPRLGTALEMVALPDMIGVDTPADDGLPAFVDRLADALDRSLDAPRLGDQTDALRPFTWQAVFDRIERVWKEVMEKA